MDRFHILLDGVEVGSPDGWDQFTHEFARDEGTRTISIKFETQLTFSGDGWQAIKDKYDAFGYCATMTFEMLQDCSGIQVSVARGTLIVADAKWNETRCTVEVSIADNGIAAQIANNKNIPVSPISTLSKNNVAIAAVPALALTLFHPADGTDITGTRRAFDWYACMKQCVAYISDAQITVSSNWYQGLTDAERYAVAIGAELRTTGFTVPRFEYSFNDLFTELAKKYDLWILAAEDANGKPFLKIEPRSYFFGDNVGIEVDNIQDLERTINTDLLYATVKVGSDDAIKELQTANALPFIVLLGFTNESFHFKGVCNTDAELDLVNKWVIDTNVIARIAEHNDDSWDDNYFLIQYTGSTSKATQAQYLFQGAFPALYNKQLLNTNVLIRYDLPGPVGANTGVVNDSFRAQQTIRTQTDGDGESFAITWDQTSPSPAQRIRFDDDFSAPNFDPANAWGNGTTPGNSISLANSRFTAQAQGLYVFSLNAMWNIGTVNPHTYSFFPIRCYFPIATILFRAKVFSSGGIQIGPDQLAETSGHVYVGQYQDTLTFSLSLNAGEYVEIHGCGNRLGYVQGGVGGTVFFPCAPSPGAGSTEQTIANISPGCSIQTSKIVSGGFIIPEHTSRIEVLTFDRSMVLDDWLHLATTPQDGLQIDGPRIAHASNIKRTIATGETKWELIKRP